MERIGPTKEKSAQGRTTHCPLEECSRPPEAELVRRSHGRTGHLRASLVREGRCRPRWPDLPPVLSITDRLATASGVRRHCGPLIKEASREDLFAEVEGRFAFRYQCCVRCVMSRFLALLLLYASGAIAISPYLLSGAPPLGSPPSPVCKGPQHRHWSNEYSRRKQNCR
jgi:hypothetical protein